METAELMVMETAETVATAEAVKDHLTASLLQDLTDHLKTMLLSKEEIVKDHLIRQVKADHQAVAMVAAVAADHQAVAAADAVVETKTYMYLISK